jgi:hypothetical protein
MRPHGRDWSRGVGQCSQIQLYSLPRHLPSRSRLVFFIRRKCLLSFFFLCK